MAPLPPFPLPSVTSSPTGCSRGAPGLPQRLRWWQPEKKNPAQLRGPAAPERGGVRARRGVLHNGCAATPRHGRVKRGRSWNGEFPGFPKPTSAPAPFMHVSSRISSRAGLRSRGGRGRGRGSVPVLVSRPLRGHLLRKKPPRRCFLPMYFIIFVSANKQIHHSRGAKQAAAPGTAAGLVQFCRASASAPPKCSQGAGTPNIDPVGRN